MTVLFKNKVSDTMIFHFTVFIWKWDKSMGRNIFKLHFRTQTHACFSTFIKMFA